VRLLLGLDGRRQRSDLLVPLRDDLAQLLYVAPKARHVLVRPGERMLSVGFRLGQ
jgi:hypothetical protein